MAFSCQVNSGFKGTKVTDGIGIVHQHTWRILKLLRHQESSIPIGEITDYQKMRFIGVPAISKDLLILRQKQRKTAIPDDGVTFAKANQCLIEIENGVGILQCFPGVDPVVVGLTQNQGSAVEKPA